MSYELDGWLDEKYEDSTKRLFVSAVGI
jgi:hypothetical protein